MRKNAGPLLSLPRLLLVVLLIAAGAGLWAWSSRAPADDAAGAAASGHHGGPAQAVSAAPVRRQDVRVMVAAIGSMAASNTAVVRAQVSGVLQSLNFREGQQVEAGQPIAQIDPRAFAAAAQQADGALARDKAQLAGAQVDLLRYRDLLSKDAIPKQQLDTQEALVHQLEGTTQVDEAALATARLQLTYAKVVAPISGRAGLKQADLGNLVQPGDPNGIVSITQTRPITLTFAVPAVHVTALMQQLRGKQAIPVEVWDSAGRQRLAVGRVDTLDNAIDASTDTIRVKALFANDDDALFPNQAVSVRLQLDVLKDALVVPQAAVQRGAKGFYVYALGADQTVSVRPVVQGAVDGDQVAVTGPLEAGEQVVVDGVDRLHEGSKVDVIGNADPAAAPAAAAAGDHPHRHAKAPAASGTAGPN